MTSSALAASLPFIMSWEGGFVDDPDDPGGRTNKGITQATYDRWRTRQGQPARDVKVIGDDEVQAIYEAFYWIPARCNLLRRKLDLIQFDTAVNMGTNRAVRILQTALGCGVDGVFGRETQDAAGACDVGSAMIAHCDIREGIYRRLPERNPKLKKFLKGWLNRLNALRAEIGLPGFEAVPEVNFGDADHIAKMPDLHEGEQLEP
jgi:lysozyme family protein